ESGPRRAVAGGRGATPATEDPAAARGFLPRVRTGCSHGLPVRGVGLGSARGALVPGDPARCEPAGITRAPVGPSGDPGALSGADDELLGMSLGRRVDSEGSPRVGASETVSVVRREPRRTGEGVANLAHHLLCRSALLVGLGIRPGPPDRDRQERVRLLM